MWDKETFLTKIEVKQRDDEADIWQQNKWASHTYCV
jgi:hypothetical protein